MTGQRIRILVLALVTLGSMAVRCDEARSVQDPDASFLEFLGSVDRLAEINPDYLSQAAARGGTRSPAAATPPAATPPPSPRPQPSSAPDASGGSS